MIADEIMNKIKNDKRFLDKFTVLNKKGDVLATGRSGLKYLNYKSVMNYLDYLNDTEFKQGGEFTEEDKYFIPHLKRIAKYYYEFVSKVYYDAIPVDRMSYQEIKNIIKVKNYISFGAEVKGQKRIIKLSVKDGWIMIVDMRQNVRTMIVNNSTTGNIWNKLKKLQIVPNDEPMRDIVNGRKPK